MQEGFEGVGGRRRHMANCHRDGKERGKGCKYGTIDEGRKYMAVTDQRQKKKKPPFLQARGYLCFRNFRYTHTRTGVWRHQGFSSSLPFLKCSNRSVIGRKVAIQNTISVYDSKVRVNWQTVRLKSDI